MRFQAQKFKFPAVLLITLAVSISVFAQAEIQPRSQEISDDENVPVLLKHLPEWESKRETASYFLDRSKFEAFFTDRKIIESVDFIIGTEAVFSKYPEGELLIVEYSTPQASSAVDKDILSANNPGEENYIYRRIGNYNVFLFDPPDAASGAALLDKIKYQKIVTWPYGDPKPFFARERDFIVGASSLFISTVLFILTFLGSAIVLGAILGILYFRARDKRRASMTAYSDAGGLTRLNIDGLTQEMSTEALLKD